MDPNPIQPLAFYLQPFFPLCAHLRNLRLIFSPLSSSCSFVSFVDLISLLTSYFSLYSPSVLSVASVVSLLSSLFTLPYWGFTTMELTLPANSVRLGKREKFATS